jgi:hypothetical protein
MRSSSISSFRKSPTIQISRCGLLFVGIFALRRLQAYPYLSGLRDQTASTSEQLCRVCVSEGKRVPEAWERVKSVKPHGPNVHPDSLWRMWDNLRYIHRNLRGPLGHPRLVDYL